MTEEIQGLLEEKHKKHKVPVIQAQYPITQLAFYVNLHRTVIGPSATLTGRWRPDIDLRRMLTGKVPYSNIQYVCKTVQTRLRDMQDSRLSSKADEIQSFADRKEFFDAL